MWLLKLLALIFNWELVWLKDHEDQFYLTRVRNNHPFYKDKWCYVYNFYHIGFVRLLSDGECKGRSYIKEWKPYKRME